MRSRCFAQGGYACLRPSERSNCHLDSRLSSTCSHPLLVAAERSEAALCSLWDLWAKAGGADGPAFERLLVALRENRSQAVGLACEMLCDSRVTAKQKQYCLLALAKHVRPEDAALVADALNDSSVLRDFDFKYLRQDSRMLFSPASLGFKDDTERRQAFDKWRAWLARKADATAPGT